ncbi:hypothetical protein F5Y17DRAFT_398081 [Xylariaceae sp. FL0594]|nr:hypothetical protein F5Y17DRAFT_398081 [Xylariaceae sp. FL0594]
MMDKDQMAQDKAAQDKMAKDKIPQDKIPQVKVPKDKVRKVKSLMDLCIATCVRNLKSIDDVGSAPYKLIRPILLKVENAYQLHQIERNSPHLIEDTPELWQRLIARDFGPQAERLKLRPSNPRSWYKVYVKHKKINEAEKQAAAERLRNAFNSIEQGKVQSTVMNYDSRKLPALTREFRAGVDRRKGPVHGPDLSELRFTGGSRTKVNTPKSLLTRAKREAREYTAKMRLNTIATAGAVKQGRVLQAPQGMVHEKVNESRAQTVRPPGSQSRPFRPAQSRDAINREARLRKAKEPARQKGVTYLSDDDLDDDLDFDDVTSPGGGLDVSALEAMSDDPEPEPKPEPKRTLKAAPTATSSSGPRQSAFARKMGGHSAAPTTSRVQVERNSTSQCTVKGKETVKKPTGSNASPPASSSTRPAPRSTVPAPAPATAASIARNRKPAGSSASPLPASVSAKPAPKSTAPTRAVAPTPASAPVPDSASRKRKAVDIFMRPRKLQKGARA